LREEKKKSLKRSLRDLKNIRKLKTRLQGVWKNFESMKPCLKDLEKIVTLEQELKNLKKYLI
jgi:hypothetical protein